MAVAATRAAGRWLQVVGEDGSGERGGVENTGLVETFGDAGGLGHGLVAGSWALALKLDVDNGLDGVETEAFPAILHLDIGQRQAVLQRTGHLGHLGPAQNPTGNLVLFSHGGQGRGRGASGVRTQRAAVRRPGSCRMEGGLR